MGVEGQRVDVDDIDLERFILEAQELLYAPRPIRQRLEDAGIKLSPAHFYSSLPLLREIDGTFEGADADRHPIYDKIFNQPLMISYISEMLRFVGEFDPPISGDEGTSDAFFWNNSQFSFSDAMAYYCLIRHIRPNRIVEIGCGFSTLVADTALRANGYGEIVCIEPYPRPFVARLETVKELIRKPIQDIDIEQFTGLIGPAEMLFIDSTHTVKMGSDCLYIYLVLLPSIAKAILVHSHDIFLPFGMPLDWARDLQIHWTEQYLVYAYLLENSRSQVVFGSNYALHYLPDETERLMDGKFPGGGGSLWYQINAP